MMRRLRVRWLSALALAAGGLLASCASDEARPDDEDPAVDEGDSPGDDGDTEADETFADFVIEIVLHQTRDDAVPAEVDFSLPDDEDPDGFAVLFE